MCVYIVMQRQLTRIERDVNKIVQHKSLAESCSGLKDEVMKFVSTYREEIAVLDERGREMTESYKAILVSLDSTRVLLHNSNIFILFLLSYRKSLVSLHQLTVKICLVTWQYL